jgi:hypothetical protein
MTKTIRLIDEKIRVIMMAIIIAISAPQMGCVSPFDRETAEQIPPGIEVDEELAKSNLEQTGASLRSVRDAQTMPDLQKNFEMLSATSATLSMTLKEVAARFESAVSAGQLELDMRNQRRTNGQIPDPHSTDAIQEVNLAGAVDSLLMCRNAYGSLSGKYRSKLMAMTQELGNNLTLEGRHAVTPEITALLEDQLQLRTLLTDVSAKSKAVIAELGAMNRSP